MLKWNHDSGIGAFSLQIPGGQLLNISMVPDEAAGSWLRIGNAEPIFVPAGTTFDLGAEELANCCGSQTCDQWPGEYPLIIEFGSADADGLDGAPPQAWFAAWRGC
jgi:hypothetical protein